MLQPITEKHESRIRAGLKFMHGPAEDISKRTIRSDNANEIKAAIETHGFSDPVTPHRPNSNKAEQSIMTFSDLLRLHFLNQDLHHVSGRYCQ